MRALSLLALTFIFASLPPVIPAAAAPAAAREDPARLLWGTYLGGGNREYCEDMVLDAAGNPILCGWTQSSNYPTTPGAFEEDLSGASDALVTKLAADGQSLIWSTLIGTAWTDVANGLAVDALGHLFVVGTTGGLDFPVTAGTWDDTHNGSDDAFIAKLSSTGGQLIWCSYLGSGMQDFGLKVVLDPAGNPVVIGDTTSDDFPTTTGAFSETFGGGTWDTFVAKFDGEDGGLIWSTLLGGAGDDRPHSISANAAGDLLLIGETGSQDFPTTAGAYMEESGGHQHAFVTLLGGAGDALVWSSFLGGTSADWGDAGVFDGEGNVVLTGRTQSTDFPTTPGCYDATHAGSWDLFIAKMTADGAGLLWATYVGGMYFDQPIDIALGASGEVIVAGWTNSPDYPTTPDAIGETPRGGADAILIEMSADGGDLVWSSYVGGAGNEYGTALVVDASGEALLAGRTNSEAFPVSAGAFAETFTGGEFDLFVVRLATPMTPVLLGGFGLSAVGAEVIVRWEIAAGTPSAEFRLLASRSGETWSLSIRETGPSLFEARDASQLLREGGEFSYSLFSREPGEEWLLLRSESITLAPSSSPEFALRAHPNPFNPSTRIVFTLAEPGEIRLSVVDTAGRRVALLAESNFAAGRHEIDWGGLDEKGIFLPSGIYLVHLETRGGSEVRKLALIR